MTGKVEAAGIEPARDSDRLEEAAQARKTPRFCRECGLVQPQGEKFLRGGLCPSCLDESGRRKRAREGQKALARAQEAGRVERDGQIFRVVVVPPRKRPGRAA